MNTLELKLKQKNQFQYELKRGNKIEHKITKCTEGWYVACTIKPTLEIAIEYARKTTEDFLSAFGSDCKVVIV